MQRQTVHLFLPGLMMLLTGCGSASPPPDYTSFEPNQGQWVIEVEAIDAAEIEKIRAAIEEVSGVEPGSVLVSSSGRYVAFETSVSTSDGEAYGAVKNRVIIRLAEFGVQVGVSKTRLK